ncbi:hypothetical protein GW17_00032038 [Ensete ventricosum]|nr:hypothetical protein GW17_00032038 [Ensete ventricosum]RZS22244.1 hypothetical protein BHM03_00054991 [Ensete ventricosum]
MMESSASPDAKELPNGLPLLYPFPIAFSFEMLRSCLSSNNITKWAMAGDGKGYGGASGYHRLCDRGLLAQPAIAATSADEVEREFWIATLTLA